MPLFEYRCAECGAEFEKLVRNPGAGAEITCPVCSSRKLDQMLSTFASRTGNAGFGSRSAGCKPAGG